MLRIPISYTLNCIVPQTKEECKEKLPHCYVFRNSIRVAVVYLNPVRIEKGSDLLNQEIEDVLSIVTENQYELEEEYRKVANGW